MIYYIFPGTFDPFTIGHADIINKIYNLLLFDQDELIIAVANSFSKNPLLTICFRKKIIESFISCNDIYKSANIQVKKVIGNLADFCFSYNEYVCVRGIRVNCFDINLSEFIYEFYWPLNLASKNPIQKFLFFLNIDYAKKSLISSSRLKNNFLQQNINLAAYDTVKILEILDLNNTNKECGINKKNDILKCGALFLEDDLIDFADYELSYQACKMMKKVYIFCPINKIEQIEKNLLKYFMYFKKTDLFNKIFFRNKESFEDEIQVLKIEYYFYELRYFNILVEDVFLSNLLKKLIYFTEKFNLQNIIFKYEKFQTVSKKLLRELRIQFNEEVLYGVKQNSKKILLNYMLI